MILDPDGDLDQSQKHKLTNKQNKNITSFGEFNKNRDLSSVIAEVFV